MHTVCYHNQKGRELAEMVGVDIDDVLKWDEDAPNDKGYNVYSTDANGNYVWVNDVTGRYIAKEFHEWESEDQKAVVMWAAYNASSLDRWNDPIDEALEARVRAKAVKAAA